MTTLVVQREYGGARRKEVVPAKLATDAEFAAFIVEQIREYLYRAGISAAHFPDELVLLKIRYTFQDTRAGQNSPQE